MSDIEKAIKKAIDELLLYRSDEFKLSVSMDTNVMAVEALQEKLERDKGCAYCMPDKNCKVCKWTRLCNGKIKDNRCTARDYKFESDDYCKFCGRKLVEQMGFDIITLFNLPIQESEHIGDVNNMVEGDEL